MAYGKNKHSNKVHNSKTNYVSSGRKTPAQKTILIVIALAIVTVISALICAFVFNKEHIIKLRISHLASEYYEDYYYPNFYSANDNAQEILARYADMGLARVPLRQLMASNESVSPEIVTYLQEHCDENATYVQFFPESPYARTSYRVEYTYSCNF